MGMFKSSFPLEVVMVVGAECLLGRMQWSVNMWSGSKYDARKVLSDQHSKAASPEGKVFVTNDV